MTRRTAFALTALLVLPAAAAAQHAAAAPSRTPPPEAAQFDFLIGQWDLTVRPLATGLAQRLHGAPRMVGAWKAWRALDGWGLEDELRISDASGNPSALLHSLRVVDAGGRRWTVAGINAYRPSLSTATAEWQGGRMTVTGRGTDADGQAYLTRSRFYDITPTSFRYQQDRSTDDGRSWTEGVLRIEARRVAATAPR